MIYHFTNVNITKLQDEMLDKGIKFKQHISAATVDENGVAENAWCEFADGTDMELVQQIIDAHDPTPIPPAPTVEEKLRLEMARSNAEMFEMMVSMMGGGM